MTVEKPCRRPDCDYPDFGCHMGHSNIADCEYVRSLAENGAEAGGSDTEMRFPWTGRALGLNDLRFISACRRPHLVGLIGPGNAGKTTLLAVLFLMMLRGVRLKPGAQFAGSYTLEGWESIARWMQLRPPHPLRFPPHTPSNTQRQPGMLHLALSEVDGDWRDILLTDAPGEWFSAWTIDEASANAEGARWIAKYADRFLLIADSSALTGPQAGSARSTLKFLARRLASANGGQSTALVWTKADVARPDKLTTDVEGMFKQHFPDGPIYSVQVPPKASDDGLGELTDLISVYSWALNAAPEGAIEDLTPAGDRLDDPFLSYGHPHG